MVRITGLLLIVCIHEAVLGDEEVSYNEIDGHPQTTYTKQIGQDDSILIKNLKEKVSKQSRSKCRQLYICVKTEECKYLI